MKKLYRKEVFYSLCIDDIQTVAEEEIGRKLTADEISEIKNTIAEKVNWYDAIANTIHRNFKAKELH